MVRENIELGIVVQKEKFLDYVKLQDLYRENDNNLKHFTRQSMVFTPTDSITLALSMMKEKNKFIAVVTEKKPIGILLSNEILSRLI